VSGSGFNESGSPALEERGKILLGKAPVVAGEALLEGVLAPLRPRLVPVLVDNTEDDVCIDGDLQKIVKKFKEKYSKLILKKLCEISPSLEIFRIMPHQITRYFSV
jgi:hypothetical protein